MGTVLQFMNESSDISITPASSSPDTVGDQSGGHVTYELGRIKSANITTVSITADSDTANKIYRCGSFVTTPAPAGTSISLATAAYFFFHNIYGREGVGQTNAVFCWRISLLNYTPGTGDVHTDYTFQVISNGWEDSGFELGNSAADYDPYGGGTSKGAECSDLVSVNTARTVGVGDRVMVEWGIRVTASNRADDVVYFEFGGLGDIMSDPTASLDTRYGSEVVMPGNLSDAYQDYWGKHGEIKARRGKAIPWSSITKTTQWSATEWGDTTRYVTRRDDEITLQTWIKQDEEFYYLKVNNIIDGCIQASDHANLFLCSSGDWATSTVPDETDYLFLIDINGKDSQTDAPNPTTLTEESGTQIGPRIWRGAVGTSDETTFPYGWTEGTWHSGTVDATPRGFEFLADNETAIASDAFTNTTGTALTTHNSNWVNYSDHYAGNTLEIGTNDLVQDPTTPALSGYYYTGSNDNDDVATNIDWTLGSWASGSFVSLLLAIDTTTANENHYEFQAKHNATTGTIDFAIISISSGTPTTLISTTMTGFTATDTYDLRAEILGKHLRIRLNGYEILRYWDTNVSAAAGYVGLAMSSDSPDNFDNFASTQMDSGYKAEFWKEGADFRIASETGGTSECPDPNTGDVSTVSKSMHCTFKIRKRALRGWNGREDIGFLLTGQCDVQGQGTTVLPGALGNQLDKPHWDYPGHTFPVGTNETSSASAAGGGSNVCLQPLLAAHTHDDIPLPFFVASMM